MLSRSLAILLSAWLPTAPLMLPIGTLHAIDALVVGTLAVILSAFALADDRARIGTAVLGVWVALSAFIFPSTLLEEVVAVSWGVSMFVLMGGPFSGTFGVTRVPAVVPMAKPAPQADRPDPSLPLAA